MNTSLLESLKKDLLRALEILGILRTKEQDGQKMNQDEPEFAPEALKMPAEPPKHPTLLWDTKANTRHSVRVICDEEGLTVEQKNTLCATVGAESGWLPKAIGKPNSNGTRDWGICQINDALWIGKGKAFESTDYVLNIPEKCIRWMCHWWKKGKRNWWIAYKNSSYKAYL